MIPLVDMTTLGSRLSEIKSKNADESRHIPSARLQDAAHQFEASLMQELMEPLGHDALSGDGDSDQDESADASRGGSTDALASFAREAMAKSLSAQGGFGIARTILHSLATSGRIK
jgi:Rod binding domain-containing protein